MSEIIESVHEHFYSDQVSRHDGSAHSVQFYTDHNFLIQTTAEFLGTALDAGEAVVIIATEPHRRGLAERLRDRDIDVARAIEQGRYFSFDAAETLSRFMVDGSPEEGRFMDVIGEILDRAGTDEAAHGKRRPVAAFGEMVALLWEAGNVDSVVRLEQLWNEIGRTRSFSLRCAYPVSGFDRENHDLHLLKICGQHSTVLPDASYPASENEPERRLAVVQLQHKAQVLEKETATRKALDLELETRRRSENNLSELAARLLNAQDQERKKLALELHDGFGQYLVAMKMCLEMMATAKSGTEREKCRLEAIELLERCIRDTRRTSYILHPPMLDELGLVSAVTWYVRGFAEQTGIDLQLDLPPDLPGLPVPVATAFFRIVQEALANVHKHSGSTSAKISMTANSAEAVLEVRDSGRGIPASALDFSTQTNAGVGLASMRQRLRELGGKLQISASSEGTILRAVIPLTESWRDSKYPH